MHKIYFEKRCIIICPPDEQALADPNAILFNIGNSSDIHDLVGMVEISESLHRVYIPTDDIESTYRMICAEFLEVNAGGGLVSNRRGDYLLISRNGLWDLPRAIRTQEKTSASQLSEKSGRRPASTSSS